MELTYTAIRQACIPPTVVISAPGLLVGSGMDGYRIPGSGASFMPNLEGEMSCGPPWIAHVEGQKWRSCAQLHPKVPLTR